MAAYIIFLREGPVHDSEEMALYRAGNRDIAGFAIKPLVVYGKQEPVEGTPPDGMVILEFPSVEEARRWYHSPAYQSAAAHRRKAADYRAVIVEGFDPRSLMQAG